MTQGQRALVRDLRESLRGARRAVKQGAQRLRCPLTGVQMKRVALAADGQFYDLAALQRHLRDHVDQRVVRSPLRGGHMACVLFYVEGKSRVSWTPFDALLLTS